VPGNPTVGVGDTLHAAWGGQWSECAAVGVPGQWTDATWGRGRAHRPGGRGALLAGEEQGRRERKREKGVLGLKFEFFSKFFIRIRKSL